MIYISERMDATTTKVLSMGLLGGISFLIGALTWKLRLEEFVSGLKKVELHIWYTVNFISSI